MEPVAMSGTASDLVLAFAKIGIDIGGVDELLKFLYKNQSLLDEGESVVKKYEFPDIPEDTLMHFLVKEEKYYINLKLTTIWIAAHLINTKLRLSDSGIPLIDLLLNQFGIPLPNLTKLSELFGEKCIIRETMLRNEKVGTSDILIPFKGKCCNNDLKCRFREGDNCNCTPNDVLEIYEELAEANMFERVGDKYKYQW